MLKIGRLYHFDVIQNFVSLYEKYDDGSFCAKLTKSCLCLVINKAYDAPRGIRMIQVILPNGIFWVVEHIAKLTPIY